MSTHMDGWNTDEHDRFCSILNSFWKLEKGIPGVENRTPELQIWRQVSNQLEKVGVRRGPHPCQSHWYLVAEHEPKLKNTFSFATKPPLNNKRNSGEMGMPFAVMGSPTARNHSSVDLNLLNRARNNHQTKPATSSTRGADDQATNHEATRASRTPTMAPEATAALPKSVPEPNAEDQPQPSHTPKSWSRDELDMLIRIMGDLQTSSEGQTMDQKRMNQIASEKLKEVGYTRSESAVDMRWRRLKQPDVEVENSEVSNGAPEQPQRSMSLDGDEPDATYEQPKTRKRRPASSGGKWTEDEALNLERIIALSHSNTTDAGTESALNWVEIAQKHNEGGYNRSKSAIQQQWIKQRAKLSASASLAEDRQSAGLYSADEEEELLRSIKTAERQDTDSRRKRKSFARGPESSHESQTEDIDETPTRTKRHCQSGNRDMELAEDDGQPRSDTRKSQPEKSQQEASSSPVADLSILFQKIKELENDISVSEGRKANCVATLRDCASQLSNEERREADLLRQLKECQHRQVEAKELDRQTIEQNSQHDAEIEDKRVKITNIRKTIDIFNGN